MTKATLVRAAGATDGDRKVIVKIEMIVLFCCWEGRKKNPTNPRHSGESQGKYQLEMLVCWFTLRLPRVFKGKGSLVQEVQLVVRRLGRWDFRVREHFELG